MPIADNEHRVKLQVIAVDMDGVLCSGEHWTPEECLTAEPLTGNISRVADLYKWNFIIIYTARKDEMIPATLEWLRRNNVRYHAISNLKMCADAYIDDKNITLTGEAL